MVAAGDPIYAEDINGLIGSFLVRKHQQADDTQNSTALKSSADLTFPVAANEVWCWSARLNVSGTLTGDFKVGVQYPAGASVPWGAALSGTGTLTEFNPFSFDNPASDAAFTTGGAGATSSRWLPVDGTIYNGSTAGNLTIRFGMGTADAGQVARLRKGSWLFAFKIS